LTDAKTAGHVARVGDEKVHRIEKNRIE